MPRQFRVPSDQELPAGPWGDFVREVGRLYRQAGRPTFRGLEDQIARSESSGHMSRERLRRMLSGTPPIPRPWADVEAALVVLAQLARESLDERVEGRSATRRRHLLDLWNRAMDLDPSARDERSADQETAQIPSREESLEPENTSDIDELLEFRNDLRTLREAIGSPSLSWMAERTSYSVTSIRRLLNGSGLPPWAVVQAFVEACNADVDDWLERWEQVRASRAPDRFEDPRRGRFAPTPEVTTP